MTSLVVTLLYIFLGLLLIPVLVFLNKFRKYFAFSNKIPGKTLKVLKSRGLNFGFGQTRQMFDFDKVFEFLSTSHEFGEPMSILTTLVDAEIEVVDPEIVKEICLNKKYGKHRTGIHIFNSLLGDGLVASEGEVWRRHRNIIMPSFSPKNVKNMMVSMCHEINLKLNDFKKNESLVFEDFNQQISQITLYVILAVAFGVELENKDKLAHLFEELTDTFGNTLLATIFIGKWFTQLPLPFFSKFKSVRHEIHQFVTEIIRKKKLEEEPKVYNELMSTLIYSRDENGNLFNDQEIFDESMTFLIAGHDTTSSVLSFFILQLAKNQKLQEELYEEILKSVKDKKLPTYEEIEANTLMNNCIKESLRMFPPASFFNKETPVEKDDDLCGYMVPKNTRLLINVLGIHYHPKYWKDPKEFNPSRWNNIQMKDVKYQFLPFSLGPRDCAGKNLALIEAPLIMTLLLLKYKIVFPENFDPNTISVSVLFTMKLKNFGIKLVERK